MVHLPRGIASDLLISQIRNTMPYLFKPVVKPVVKPVAEPVAEMEIGVFENFQPARIVARAIRDRDEGKSESHLDYFALCLASHFLTCATPVPTDVDNQIRRKLWPPEVPLETALRMADLVLESRRWDFATVSERAIAGLSGHLGEWFTVATAAYGAMDQYRDGAARDKRAEILRAIAEEVEHHSEVFGSLWRTHSGIESLKASAVIAHNFGDLDRVIEMWEIAPEDPLRLLYSKLASVPFDQARKLRYLGRLWVAGELYKSPIEGSSMAMENHRHFALRKPRCLRRSRNFLIPFGPFFDEWGRSVARGLSKDGDNSEVTEVTGVLKQGWLRLSKTVGYGRALRGIFEVRPDLEREVVADLPKLHRQIIGMRQEVFEKKWADEALGLMDEIPARAT